MKYGIGRWIVSPGDRKSLSFYIPEVQDFLQDDRYIGESLFDGTCSKYFFQCEDSVFISEEIINGLGVQFLNRDDALAYIRTNTNLVEESDGKFIINNADEIGEISTPDMYLIIL